MAILLKTVSARVSSIQIMQVRVQNKGKSVWKSRYDGDVSWLYRIDVRERAFALPLGDMSNVYHVQILTWGGGGFLLSPCVRWTGLVIVILTWRPLLLILSI